MRCDELPEDQIQFQRKCVALSKVIQHSSQMLEYAKEYLKSRPDPFIVNVSNRPKKKLKNEAENVPIIPLLKSFYHFLNSDPSYFKDLWDWSKFVELYYDKGNNMQKLYGHLIMGILTNMIPSQLSKLIKNIPKETILQFDGDMITDKEDLCKFKVENIRNENDKFLLEKNEHKIVLNNEMVTNIEGVLLPIYNQKNVYHFEECPENDNIVRVNSTKANLRNIAIGISSGKAICLSGPVGCGKTTLVEYLAQKTGRIFPSNLKEYDKCENNAKDKTQLNGNNIQVNGDSRKRKENFDAKNDFPLEENDATESCENSFLRIQLGDQTDSKMLLGQYRCTDIPGEFIWLPGVLTQAVMNGYWLLLEDLDSATQDTYTVLSNLLENNYLSVPGFHDCIKVQPGFQLFLTVRTHKHSSTGAKKMIFSLLEKYLHNINILPLSPVELCEIVSLNYPKLKSIARRIVDVFLNFSSGDHSSLDHLRYEEQDNKEYEQSYIPLPYNENFEINNSTTNSGRLVSTRDLIKLCQRSNPSFSVTSMECAYFVFQNAVDVFCSHLSQGVEKTKLIINIGAKLGVIQSRCEFFSQEYKPIIEMKENEIQIGRAILSTNNLCNLEYKKALSHVNKKMKISSNATENNKSRTTFSFTRITSCLLERIAVCVSQNEPILLVGETGVGKTSAVQYLAEKTNHKLVVINMNNQSDISDLLGGFKPVDFSYVMAPLRIEFENIFRKTFNTTKNEKFLVNFSTCYNQGNFNVLIKAMLKVVQSVFNRVKKNDFKVKNPTDHLREWTKIRTKLLKLETQLKKSINISFAFIAGSLVNCIESGNWILLDEINLASAETLECLSTILEPEGSVILLEKGDCTPVKRHPDFRIFACMNPNTDIGKKDLPTGIRNRFTEFFVDELTTENDLVLLVSDYLNNTGIRKPKVLSIVKLYKTLKSLSRLELNDGLGNRPVFSLRTLCRALRICAKNLCGSIERNLYESFCLSFLTQMDPNSHKIVLHLIQTAMLKDAKAILSQEIPKPGENYINFEGYWIQKGPKELEECKSYILTDGVKQNLKDLARIISIGKLPILLQGPTSAGKTSLIEYIAKTSGNHCLRINNHEHTDLQEYIGAYTSDVTGKLCFKEGVLAQAMRNGYWIILDELNLASTDILEALNRVLDDNRELFIPETQTVIKAHPNFMLFATQNPPGLYGGRKTLSRAFKNRFIELHFSEIPKNELEIILEKRCLIPKSYSVKMVKCMSDLYVNRKTTTRNVFTLRDLFRWGNRYTYADKNLLEDNLYDWNQHLVDEGYLVLSAKVRTSIESEIIQDALYSNFRKKISTRNLFLLHENTSMVTRGILEQIEKYKGTRTDIIWTENMSRMAVLTAKALQFNEPVLLVGPTGCGKTTVCQILASIHKTEISILNCHMHTEGADFLGGLRPCRGGRSSTESPENQKSNQQLFEWTDGPLVISMQKGSYFMADEISLAEDSVLERLNCILEPERTVLLAEKGGISNALNTASNEFLIHAKEGFQFLATMNPGGDFGKKELSPALRNRFTEIWCLPSDAYEDLVEIAKNGLRLPRNKTFSKGIAPYYKEETIAKILIDTVFFLKSKIDKFKFSIRDILSWTNYIVENVQKTDSTLSIEEIIIFGLETIFLDSLEMLPYESLEYIEKIRSETIHYMVLSIQSNLQIPIKINATNIEAKKGNKVITDALKFGIEPFFIEMNSEAIDSLLLKRDKENFLFDAPTTRKNLFRILSALTLNKAILLEGPPGVGKTSTIENLASAIGYKIVRINLCEHTDLVDLFGTDLPAEDTTFTVKKSGNANEKENMERPTLGSFVWRDGPLLAALKSKNTWILLDELNLAPQSVLEGLNAILDHRGEVYIPELNKTFHLNRETKIFAAQNPLKQGGGRKGLPQSFLNRFTKVFLRKLTREDLLFVINGIYSEYFMRLQEYFMKFFNNVNLNKNISIFDLHKSSKELFLELNQNGNMCGEENFNLLMDLPERMVEFSEVLDKGITNLEFGYKGGPFEINLRDILRWCDLLKNENTGFVFSNYKDTQKSKLDQWNSLMEIHNEFILNLYERMKLIYHQRMRSDLDRKFIRDTFGKVFNCDADKLDDLSKDVSLYWTESKIYFNDIVINRDIGNDAEELSSNEENEIYRREIQGLLRNSTNSSLILSSQRETLKNLVECVEMEKPVILCGPTDSGKTKVIDILCSVSNQSRVTDTIDDSVTGSFQQIDLNRHLEEISQNVEKVLNYVLQCLIFRENQNMEKYGNRSVSNLLKVWRNYIKVETGQETDLTTTSTSSELILFKKRLKAIKGVIEKIIEIRNEGNLNKSNKLENFLHNMNSTLVNLENLVENADSLNTGGYFEWVDSKIVKSLKRGQYISLEHVNLCSSAVLDRLNPVFEPNGCLLLSEKGVTTITDESEIVEKHKNFRAFLTIDPKNGDLSRAMRNRCIEISTDSKEYTEDDLKRLIYRKGVEKLHLIKILLRIHKEILELTQFSNFTISHLLQFAFLHSSYSRIGYSDENSLYSSGMEVYVYSSHRDLLGYGLPYYHNKLRDIILNGCEECRNPGKFSDITLENVALTSEHLNTVISMIKLQCEPLRIVLKSYPNEELCTNLLKDVFADFNNYNSIKITFQEAIPFILSMIYECSTLDDLETRYLYVKKLLNEEKDLRSIDLIRKLEICNDVYFQDVKSANIKSIPTYLPWNKRLFPRIREYKKQQNMIEKDLQLNLLMMWHSLSKRPEIPEQIKKFGKLTPFDYSYAVASNKISDVANNEFLKHLYPFLKTSSVLLDEILLNIEMDMNSYYQILISLLWINRLQERSKGSVLFKGKIVDGDLLDKLLLHFKWIEKHLIKSLKEHGAVFKSDFRSEFEHLRNYVGNLNHPLNFIQKYFCKKMTNFISFHSNEQIETYTEEKHFENTFMLIPKYGTFNVELIIKKANALLKEETEKLRSEISTQTYSNLMEYFSDIHPIETTTTTIGSHMLRSFVDDFIRKIKESTEETSSSNDALNLQEIHNSILNISECIHKNENCDNEETEKFFNKSLHLIDYLRFEVIPLKEYFAEKALLNRSSHAQLNEIYFKSISTMNCKTINLVNLLSSTQHEAFIKMWSEFLKEISNCDNVERFNEIRNLFTMENYRNLSTLCRITQKDQCLYLTSNLSRKPIMRIFRDFERQQGTLSSAAESDELNSINIYGGPPLTSNIMSILFLSNGAFRPIPLKDLNGWRKHLKEIQQLLWNNSNLTTKQEDKMKNSIEWSVLEAKKLLFEIQSIQTALHHSGRESNSSEYENDFQKCVNKLVEKTNFLSDITRKGISSDLTSENNSIQLCYEHALLIAIMGALETCLLSFTPLVDPVEKVHLKKRYLDEDIVILESLKTVYGIMKSVMGYFNFGSTLYEELERKIVQLHERCEKFTRRTALRPETSLYSNMIKDITHYLKTNCEPKMFLSLISLVEECFCTTVSEEGNQVKSTTAQNSLKLGEAIKRINLWISNSQKFLYHTLEPYSIYYRDFYQAIECSLIRVRFGFERLQTCLEQVNNSMLVSIKEKHLHKLLTNLLQFPTTEYLDIFDSNSLGQMIENTNISIMLLTNHREDYNITHFRLMKSKLMEIKNRIIIRGTIEGESFCEFDAALSILNDIWQEEEEVRRKRQIEEESLYLTKTRGESRTEEELELEEIQINFPTSVQEDFGEFIQQDTLEQIVKVSKLNDQNKKLSYVFGDEEYKFIGENFIYLMESYSRLYYYNLRSSKSFSTQSVDISDPFQERLSIFVRLFEKFKSVLSEKIDENIYNSLKFAVGLQENLLKQTAPINKNDSCSYNYYKDSNINEIVACTSVMDKIEERVKKQLELYPDHATLNDIITVMNRIRNLPVNSPLVRFNVGFQILRQKVSQWNEVAHKNNNLRDLEIEVAEFVQRWTRLELNFWRNCLSQTFSKVENKVYRYWFFIYNLLHEYIKDGAAATDYENVGKSFYEFSAFIDERGKHSSTVVTIKDIMNILKRFMESANYCDFSLRMKLLKSFEFYLYYTTKGNQERKDKVISGIRNIQIFFNQFSGEIETKLKTIRTPIEKKLREFVKIESYNKDLSYFSMKNNVARVHRNLNKFLKEYENSIKESVHPVFQLKENNSDEYSFDNDKGINLRYEAKMKYYMIDVKNFIASPKLKDKFIYKIPSRLVENIPAISDEDTDFDNPIEKGLNLLQRIEKLFTISRMIVGKTISKTSYPKLIYSLDSLLTNEMETCEYLRKLEVDRSQEKPKQKMQAKSILQQKRKGLSDLFKTLSQLGLNYRTGIMESSLNADRNVDYVDFEISPFCVRNMFATSKYNKLDQNIIYLSDKLDTYFAKCIFKLKLLQNVLLSPKSEIGQPNLERMKGFSIDMFLLVQNQRRLLSESIRSIYDLRNVINDVQSLQSSAEEMNFDFDDLNFICLENELKNIKKSLERIQYCFGELKSLIKCAPEDGNESSSAIKNNPLVKLYAQTEEQFILTLEQTRNILNESQKLMEKISSLDKVSFLSFKIVKSISNSYKDLLHGIVKLKEKIFSCSLENSSPIASSLERLLNNLEVIDNNTNNNLSVDEIETKLLNNNMETEIENVIHHILLAMQKLYKKYSSKEETESANNSKTDTENSGDRKDEKEEEEEDECENIKDNHLKEEIHSQLTNDLKTLNIGVVVKKLSNILTATKSVKNFENKERCVKKICSLMPVLEQFNLLGDYFLFQQLGAHKVSSKMLSIMLTVFIDLSTKGFCIPPDLMQDTEEGEGKQKEKSSGEGGFGLEDGTGENDVSDKIESEDQLEDAKRPEDRSKEEEQKDNKDCKEEKGIEMSEDFDANMQDVEKPEEDESEKSENEEDLDKQMGDTEQGADKLDDQIWGSDEDDKDSEQEDEENGLNEEEDGKGSKDEDDKHNNLSSKNETGNEDSEQRNEDGLDATNEDNTEKKKKKQEKDIDDMKDSEMDEEQVNPYHNDLEDPPEPEDMDLGDNCNLDEEVGDENKEDRQDENPFDIDAMKDTMEITEEDNEENKGSNDEEDNKAKNDDAVSDSESEPEAGTKLKEEGKNKDEPEEENQDTEKESVHEDEEELRRDAGENQNEEESPEDEKKQIDESEDHHQSKDKQSKEQNIQSIPEKKTEGSADQVTNDADEVEQSESMDPQDTGEDKEGVGQAENDASEKGHQGITDTKQTKPGEQDKQPQKEKRKQGLTDEERTLGEAEKNKIKQLKTIDKLKDNKEEGISQHEEELDEEMEAPEFQHVKEPKKGDKTTLDNATEEQSKMIKHLEEEDMEDTENENEENDLNEMDDDEERDEDENLEEIPELNSEKFNEEEKSNKPSKSEKSKEKCETTEKMEVDGEIIETSTVLRGDDTIANCNKDILMDKNRADEPSSNEILEMRKMYQDEIATNRLILPDQSDNEMWQMISHKMLPNARELCEQLRLILEPTKCTRLKGDYRTGRRINMKKIIPYIASQFRKDKIWLRRTKPAQRDYKITIAIDDSKSMHHNNSKTLTLQAISLISQALTLLESGMLSIVSFGESPKIILNHTEQFNGPKLVKCLNFDQNQSRIAQLLDFVRTVNTEENATSKSDNGIFENLLLILSDGRNIFSEGEQKVKNAIKLARLQRVFLVYVIIDNPENKHSILDIKMPSFTADKKSIIMNSYLDVFPFPYFVIVRDLGQLPIVLSEAMRQWFELVNSEQ